MSVRITSFLIKNFIATYIFDKFEAEAIVSTFKLRIEKFPRLKQKVHKFLGHFYWKNMTPKEFAHVEKNLYIDLKDERITNEEQLGEFLSSEIMIKEPLNTPQWRLMYKEDFMEGKSLIILKLHHTLTDGYGLMTFLSNIADNTKEITFGHLPKYSLVHKVLSYLTLPYHFMRIALFILPYPRDNNIIAPLDKKSIGVKKGRYTKEFSVMDVKKKCKEY